MFRTPAAGDVPGGAAFSCAGCACYEAGACTDEDLAVHHGGPPCRDSDPTDALYQRMPRIAHSSLRSKNFAIAYHALDGLFSQPAPLYVG
jgi:hypothetical protein